MVSMVGTPQHTLSWGDVGTHPRFLLKLLTPERFVYGIIPNIGFPLTLFLERSRGWGGGGGFSWYLIFSLRILVIILEVRLS